MRTKEIIKREIEEKITTKLNCDNCNDNIEWFDYCGFGISFTLKDAWCSQEGGKTWEFCSFKCLKDFINKNALNEPMKNKTKGEKAK